jgi:hypothetical protein
LLDRLWKQFLKTAGGPPAYIADQKNLRKTTRFSEKLEKAGGKSRPRSLKIRFQRLSFTNRLTYLLKERMSGFPLSRE